MVALPDTAEALGSGDVPVLATPRLLAWAEEATCAAVAGALAANQTSVGKHVELSHLAPSPLGERVTVSAVLVAVDGRLLRFEVTAEHPDGSSVARGAVTRAVVDRDRFLARLCLPGPSGPSPDQTS
ncbi:thioesterase family protein [Actinopolymorpha alba]|uniref:thioesterase family protein n=1 Tax=Actinopolymorpha alba TaxID=533267 RepID=UPI000363E9EE|nr:hotdog domain-containing protein [Actinopolymorpha alba]